MAHDITAICGQLAEGKSLPSIYGLCDADGRLRYIGKANNPAKRLQGHLRETRRRSPLYDWIKKNGAPSLCILEAGCANWREAEKRLIAEARERGEKLLNLADGGDEPYCPKEVRANNGRAVAKAIQADPKRRDLWHLKRSIGKNLKDGFVSNETRAKLRRLASERPDLFGLWRNIPDAITP